MQTSSHIEVIVKRDRWIVIFGLVALIAIAWSYTIWVAQSSTGMDMSMGMDSGNVRHWTGIDFTLMFAMWVVMMVAMMENLEIIQLLELNLQIKIMACSINSGIV